MRLIYISYDLEYDFRPREANRFKVDITIAAQGKVTFNLTYQELLQRNKGFYEHTVYVNPGQVMIIIMIIMIIIMMMIILIIMIMIIIIII